MNGEWMDDVALQSKYAYLYDVTICDNNQKAPDKKLISRFLKVARKYNLTRDEEESRFSFISVKLLGCKKIELLNLFTRKSICFGDS